MYNAGITSVHVEREITLWNKISRWIVNDGSD